MTEPPTTADTVTGGHPEPADVSAPLIPPREDKSDEDDLDMTPMVDVTFLLLIFFMITAAFSLQKSISFPTPEQEENAAQARTLQEVEEDFDYVIVEIHDDDSVFVDEVEASSKQDLLEKLRDARDTPKGSSARGPSNLLVMAHPDCRHETVVMALDAGNAVGMEDVKLTMAEDSGY
ncbi:MAG: biopolymer transporter ExbD [Candidatus Nealsonbacteria bacterium]|nr:biopolymer transporter ExbD [Candidatus Nealsonbacteria bacterium]